jgi:hypothetical protein
MGVVDRIEACDVLMYDLEDWLLCGKLVKN